jgi:peptide chain release factor 2
MKILRSRLYEKELQERREEAEEQYEQESEVDFGSQIRSYVLHPYQQIKDLRTELEIGDVESVLDGELDEFIEAYLLQQATGESTESQEESA